jgi:hypothetical protein
VFTPQSSTPYVDQFVVRPFTYGPKAQPVRVDLTGSIPGDVPALANVELTTKQALDWALVGWASTPATSSISGSTAAFKAFNGNDDVAAARSGWTTVDSTLKTISTTVASASTTYTAQYSLDPSLLPTDPYAQGDRAIEVWALTITDAYSSTITASLMPAVGSGPTRYTDEYGSTGKLIPSTSTSGSLLWTRLGTLHLPNAGAREMRLVINGVATDGQFGLARILVLPVRQRAALPTGKTGDSTYPVWSTSTTETVKTISSDLSTVSYQPSTSTVPYPDRSIGGTVLEITPGNASLITAFANVVPDDPAVTSQTEYLTAGTLGSPTSTTVAQAALHVSIIPRFAQLRS